MTTRTHLLFRLRSFVFAAVVSAGLTACNAPLILLQSQALPLKGPIDSNLVLTEAEDNDSRLYMMWEVGGRARSDISSFDWVSTGPASCVGLSPDMVFNRRQNDLFPFLVTWVSANNRINMTFGNSIGRIGCPGIELSETTDFWPGLVAVGEKRYLIWWDNLQLKVAEYQGQGVLAGKQTIFTRQQGQFSLRGAFQPNASILGRYVHIVSALGGTQRSSQTVLVLRSSDMTTWTPTFVTLERNVAPRPVIVTFDNRLFLFYMSTVPDNTVRYLVSDDGITWSREYNLPVSTALDSTGLAGSLSGVGVARHFDKLAIAWVTDQNSTSPDDIYLSTYDAGD